MQGSTGKFAEIRLTQNRLNYVEFRTLVNPDEHALSYLKSVQCRCEVTTLLKAGDPISRRFHTAPFRQPHGVTVALRLPW